MNAALQSLLERAQNVQENGSGWRVSCPLPDHGKGRADFDPSVNVDVGQDGAILVNCRAGCSTENIVEAWGLSMADLFEHRNGYRAGEKLGGGGSYTSSETRSTHQRSTDRPCTLENYAEYVQLPLEFLKSLSLETYYRLGKPAVRMSYLDATGEEVLLIRSRVSLTGKPKVMTRKGDKHRLYGLWKLEDAREAGYCWLLEGESDTQTAWYYKEPAAGIPGANGWKAEWASELEGTERLYFVIEDEAGERCWEKLAATPEIRERLYRVELEGVKDLSGLHKSNPQGFSEALEQARKNATAWLDIAESEEQERARQAWSRCAELAESPDILAEFIADLERCRLVGEEKNAQLLYLVFTSRLLEKIVSAAVKGVSSAGKSYLVGQVMSFFPEGAFWFFTGMSERTLLYTEESLSHKHIILSEAVGMGGDFQEYVIRTLLSEGFLEYEFVEKTAEGLRPRRIHKEGPTGFVTTTTRNTLNAENETRYLSLTVTDTREQTRSIFKAIAGDLREEPDRQRWHALQNFIEAGERRVSIPYAATLAEKMGDVAVRLRRDFAVVLSLIKTHAILHQATRKRDSEGRILADLTDYAKVRELVADLVAEGVEATVPATIRRTVAAVEKLIAEGDEDQVTTREVAAELDIDKAAASRRVRSAIDRGYLKNLEDRKGRPARIVLGEPMPEDAEILPSVEKLGDRCSVDRVSGGVSHPPPPSEEPAGSESESNATSNATTRESNATGGNTEGSNATSNATTKADTYADSGNGGNSGNRYGDFSERAGNHPLDCECPECSASFAEPKHVKMSRWEGGL